MLNNVRNILSGPTLFFIVAACALPFVFLGTSSLGTIFGQNYGDVNGMKVTEQDIQIASNIVASNFRDNFGDDFDMSLVDEDIQINALKNEIVSSKISLSLASKLGLINNYEQRQTKKDIIRNPNFSIDGQFNEDRFEAFINANGFSKSSYIDIATSLNITSKLMSTLSTTFITESEINDFVKYLEKSSDIVFIRTDLDAISSNLVFTEDDLYDFYNQNKSNYYSGESRSINYILLNKQNYADEIFIPENYYEESYESYLAQIDNAVQKRISHIMIEKSKYKDPNQPLNLINEIKNNLNNGSSFSSLAEEFSDDLLTAEIGGDLDFYADDLFPQEFGDAIALLDVNQVSDIVELEESYHLIKVTEVYKDEIKTFNEMKTVFENDILENESLALMFEDYDEVLDIIANNEGIQSIANYLNTSTLKSDLLEFNDFDLPIIKEIKDRVFSNEKFGSEIIDDNIVVYEVVEIRESQQLDYENVSNLVKSDFITYKSNEEIEKLKLDLASISSDDYMVIQNKYNFISGDAYKDIKGNSSLLPQEVVFNVSQMKVGESRLIETDDGIYHLTVNNITLPNASYVSEVKEEYTEFANTQSRSGIIDLLNDQLYTNARINVNIGAAN